MAEDVQPGAEPSAAEGQPQEPGQGAPAESPGLYKEVLEGVPEEFHPSLIEKLKGMDAKATQRFQEKAEQTKPYEEAGVFDAEPESLQGWLNLSNALEAAVGGDEQAQKAVYEWWDGVGDQLGFYQDDQGTGQEGEAQDLLDLTPQKLQEMVGEQLTEKITPLMERLDQQEQEKLLDEARQGISDDLSQLRKENPNLTDEDERYILTLAWQFGQESENPVQVGAEEFKRLVARGESDLFKQKIEQPAPAEGGGLPDTSAPTPNSENAKDLAMERLKQLQAT